MVSLRKKSPAKRIQEQEWSESEEESKGRNRLSQRPRRSVKNDNVNDDNDNDDDDDTGSSEFRPESSVESSSAVSESERPTSATEAGAASNKDEDESEDGAEEEDRRQSRPQKRSPRQQSAQQQQPETLQFEQPQQHQQQHHQSSHSIPSPSSAPNPFRSQQQSDRESMEPAAESAVNTSMPTAPHPGLVEEVMFLMNMAVKALTVDRPSSAFHGGRGRGRYRRRDDEDEEEFGGEAMEQIIEINRNTEGRFECPLPGCDKDFKVQPSFKYHSQHHLHDLQELFNWAYTGEGKQALLERWAQQPHKPKHLTKPPGSAQDLWSLLSPLSQMRHLLPLQAEQFNYSWEGLESKFVSFFLFEYFDGGQGGSGGGVSGAGGGQPNRPYRRRERTIITEMAITEIPVSVVEKMDVLGPQLTDAEDSGQPSDDFWPKATIDPQAHFLPGSDRAKIAEYLPLPRTYTIQHMQGSKHTVVGMESEASPFTAHAHESFGKRGFTVNCGGAVWATEWCPGVPRDEPQYLAVGGARDPAKNYVINQREYNEKGSIQLWRFAPGVLQNTPADSPLPLPVLDMVIVHEHGCAWDIKWFPGNTYDSLASGWSTTAADRRLGVLSVAFNDGTFAIYSVPHPLSMRALAEASQPQSQQDSLSAAGSSSSLNTGAAADPVCTYLKLPAVFEVQLEEDAFTRIAWSPAHPHRRVAVGTSRGGVMIWDTMEIVQAVRTQHAVDPVYCFVAHENYVRGLDWCSKDRDFLGSVLVSTGYDGRVCILDLRDFMAPSVLSRSRGFVTDVLWRPQFDGMIWTNPDNLIRYASNADLRKSSAVIQHHAIVWAIDASDYHLFVASASADGTLLITNPLRSRNRRFKNLHVPVYKTLFRGPTPADAAAATDKTYGGDSGGNSVNNGTVMFQEELRPEERMTVAVPPELMEPDAWVCCVRWHPLASASTWLASGLRNGLLRVESVGSDGQSYGGRQ